MFPILIGGAIFYFGAPAFTAPMGLIGLGSFAVAGIAAAKTWFASDELTDRAFRDLQRKARTEHMRRLRDLRRALRGDRDPRTSSMLKRLQRIYDRLLATQRWQPPPESDQIYAEVRDQASQLYESCLGLLERSLEIWKVSRDVATNSAKQQLVDSREKLITEVQQSIGNLEQTLDHMQTTQLKGGADVQDDALQLRTELDQGLEVARQVEKRMQELEVELKDRQRSSL